MCTNSERTRVEQFGLRVYLCMLQKGARAGVVNPVLQKISTGKEEHGAKGNAVRMHRWLFRGRDFTHALLRLFMFPPPYYNPLSPIWTFTQDTVGYTRILQPPTAFVTRPILITHDARCDPTREAIASRAYQEESNLRFLAWTARQTLPVLLYHVSKVPRTSKKCLHQRLACATLLCGIRGIRFHEQYHFLFQNLPGIKWIPRDSAMTENVMKRNNSMQSSRTLKITTSRYHSTGTW